MSQKRFKHRRLPICKKFDSANTSKQYQKVIEEFCEFVGAYANASRKADLEQGERNHFKDIMLEAFDLSQVVQQFIHIAIKNHGKYYNISEDDVYTEGINKNAIRGYYEDI